MQSNGERLQKLVARVGEFHITDRAMKKAQTRMVELLASGAATEADIAAYRQTVRRYFAAFESEARGHLRTLDKRLEAVNQVHFNLTAERNMAVRRIEGTQSVLSELEQIENGSMQPR